MSSKLSAFFDKTIYFGLFAIAAATPLIFFTGNSEIFEVPKMFFIYFVTTVIFSCLILKSILDKKILFSKSAVFFSLLALVAAQTLSTLFSIDKFTSVYGYPSRLNGGLVSQFVYLTLFLTASATVNSQKAKKLFLAFVLSALLTSLWGIPSHFGKDPTCFLLTNRLTSSCWQKEFDPTVRIFSTLGQPNWLASYLVLVLPFSLAFTLTAIKKTKFLFGAISAVIFLALIFTNSRSGAVGAILALAIFFLLLGKKYLRKNLKILIPVVIVLAIVSLLFGATLFSRIKQTSSKLTAPNQGTESTVIRMIVWEGALKIFQKYPLLGTGPETFAYSYYQVRPLAHNQTTEWNFFYNKAHNEFLNYLSNTGTLGLGAYLVFLIFSIKALLAAATKPQASIFPKAALAAIAGYQLTIFFGFSTVAPQAAMFLILPLALLGQNDPKTISLKTGKPFQIFWFGLASLFALGAISFALRLEFADLISTRAKSTSSSSALLNLSDAIILYPSKNPFYMSDYATELSQLAQSSQDDIAGTQFASEAEKSIEQTLKIAPNNIIVVRRLANAYLLIVNFSDKYQNGARTIGEKIVSLAPTDPQSYLTNAKILAQIGDKPKTTQNLQEALKLRPNYPEAQDLLDQIK